jgi:uncharacterized membrane protein
MNAHIRPVTLALVIGILGFAVFFGFASISGRGEIGAASAAVVFLFGGAFLIQKYPASGWYGGGLINLLIWAFFRLGAGAGQFDRYFWGLVACLATAYAGSLIGYLLLRLKIVFSRTMKILIMAIPLVLIVVMTYMLNAPRPLSSGRQAFVGLWKSGTGFELRIQADGTATIAQDTQDHGTASERLNIATAPSRIESANVEFRGDSLLTVVRHAYYGRTYRIDRAPARDSTGMSMVLNGVRLSLEK